MKRSMCTAACLMVIGCLAAVAEDVPIVDFTRESTLPRGPGLAAAYPGDRGMERDEKVDFAHSLGQLTITGKLRHGPLDEEPRQPRLF